MSDHKLIFVGGLHRSGTSLLFKCLRDHPCVSGFKDTGVSEDEGQFLQPVYPTAKVYGGPGRFGFNPASYLHEDSPLVSSENAHKIFAAWSNYWDLEKPFLLEKSPPNLVRSRFLQALFPASYFIIMVRHPIAVSYATRKWSKTHLHSLVEHWLVCQEKFSADSKHLSNLLVLKYEDFVTAPQATLDSICAFLGVNSIALGREVRKGVNDKYWLKWQTLRTGKLTKRLYALYITARFETRVNRFGYSLKHME